jgi:hypothetical protein
LKELFLFKYCSIAFVILPGRAGGLAQELLAKYAITRIPPIIGIVMRKPLIFKLG